MHHKSTLTIGNATGRPYHIQCACGSAGDFNLESGARAWYDSHTSRIGPTETKELFVPGAAKKTVPLAKAPVKPAPPPAKVAPQVAKK